MQAITRYITDGIRRKLVAGKVNVLYGARRVGKTYLIKSLKEELGLKTYWMNGEDTINQQVLQERSVAKYHALFSSTELLIVDEAQVIPEIGKILKLIVDELPHLRIIASGSSAFDLGNRLGEPLLGRAFWHELFPLAQLELKSHENPIETKARLEERLLYGSYPEVYTLNTLEDKREYLHELSQATMLKDLLAYEGIQNGSKIRDLLRLVAWQLGKEVSMQELGSQLQISKNTVEKYLDLLEKVYILKQMKGYSKNLRKEVTKTSRWFFWDNGIRNAIINDFKPLALRNDVGELWENYVITERLKKNSYMKAFAESYFWRTYDQQEIDYVEVKNQFLSGYEIKWGSKVPSPPAAFAKAYPDAEFAVINRENYLDFIA